MEHAAYDARNWFWTIAGNTSRAWSSLASAYVTTWPAEMVSDVESFSRLRAILKPAKLAMPVEALETDDYAEIVQTYIDEVAKSRGYADGVAMASYVSSANQQWSDEAVVFSKWRDDVWAYAYQQFSAVQEGQRQKPNLLDIVAELPPIDWQAVPMTDLRVALNRIVALENALGEFVSRIESGT